MSNTIKCPWCAAKVIEATEFTRSYYDPKFNCKKCKKSGTLSWSAESTTSTARPVKVTKEKSNVIKSNRRVFRKS